jgi:peptide/nickel transport system permease protein
VRYYYFLIRLLSLFPVLAFISLIVFIVTYLIPGDPAATMLGIDATEEQISAVRESMGLDAPVHVRYWLWLERVFHGDLGISYVSKQPVALLIKRALPVTLQLMVLSTAVALLISVPAALISAVKKGSKTDAVVTVGALTGISTPAFWLGILLIYLFSVRLRILPATGYVPLEEGIIANLRSMFLPAVTQGAIMAAPLMRYLRSSLLRVMGEDYILTARMKGVRPNVILVRYVLKNALIPFITILGLSVAQMVGGTIIIEEVFALPGIGRLALSAVLNRDYSVVQAVVLVMATAFVLINLAVDMLYGLIDPRIRINTRAGA